LALDYSNNSFTFVSAPVFARPDGLAKKQATWMVGGEQQGRAVATTLLSLMGSVVDFGDDVGAANVVKLCGNFLIAASIEAIAESMALAEKSGVDREKVMNLLSSTIFDCLIYKGYGQRVSQRDHRPGGFSLTLGAKDVALVSQAARDSDVPMPFLSILNDRFTSSKARGRGEFDWSAIGLSVAEDAGVDVSNDVKRNIKDGRAYRLRK
jgi:3-hydroxyisobutyrate dehydrogenase-like beta-hydroxyacid dehydrogenase